jgi:hypothetical protein
MRKTMMREASRMDHERVFLIDVDSTLFGADRVTLDLERYLEKTVGRERQQQYWRLFNQLRNELGYADYFGLFQRFRIECARS